MDRIYLDNAATVPVLPEAVKAMEPYFGAEWGNPSAKNLPGLRAGKALEEARRRTAVALGCADYDVCFTSGGTESDMLALLRLGRGHVITTAIEHSAVISACRMLEGFGAEVTYVMPGSGGAVDPDDVVRAIRPDTSLIAVMYANNETGVLQPVEEIAGIARERGITFFTDAVQAPDPAAVVSCGADVFSLSGHKLGAPKGSGLLCVRKGIRIARDGEQEYGIRPGTQNVAFAFALSAALESKPDLCRVEALRDRLERRILDTVPSAVVNGEGRRVPGILNVSFPGTESEGILFLLGEGGVDAAAGSACTSSSPSHVLTAMGLSAERVSSAVRFSVGRMNTEEEIDRAAEVLRDAVRRIIGK